MVAPTDYPGLRQTEQGIIKLTKLLDEMNNVGHYNDDANQKKWYFKRLSGSESTHTIYEQPKDVPTNANLNISQVDCIIHDGGDGCLNLDGRVYRLPPHCVLQIKNGGRFYNGTLISQETIIVGDNGSSLPSMPDPCAFKGYKSIEPVPYYPMQNRDEPALWQQPLTSTSWVRFITVPVKKSPSEAVS